ncbi:MAG: hypothetical protein Q4A24_08315, partial [Akkermansia sp.]|nr:hypothetical protein [Akkermansia sp.]
AECNKPQPECRRKLFFLKTEEKDIECGVSIRGRRILSLCTSSIPINLIPKLKKQKRSEQKAALGRPDDNEK